jgi:hypothetical protein
MFLGPGSRVTGGVAARRAFPAGTQLAFINAVAPVGWVRVSTYDDAALRIIGSATPGSGGTNGFSTVMAQTTVGNTTLTSAQIPAHTHSITFLNNLVTPDTGAYTFPNAGSTGGVNRTTDNGTGGGGSHNHTITMSMKYVDALIAKKS